jgi:uncharacterized protein
MKFDPEHTPKREPLAQRKEQFAPPEVRGVRKLLYGFLAGCFFALAAMGAFLPLLPTTPFLLLASYFLIRISPRLNRRLLQMKLFGPFLRDWQEHRAIRRTVRRRALAVVVGVLIASYLTIRPSTLGTLGFTLCGAIGLVVILRLPVLENAGCRCPAGKATAAPHQKGLSNSRCPTGEKSVRDCA